MAAKALSCSEIKTKEDFEKSFPGFTIESRAKVLISAWSGGEQKKKVVKLIRRLAPRIVSGMYKIKRTNEYSLYSLFIDVLLPLLEISTCEVKGELKGGYISTEQVQVVSKIISSKRSRPTSRSTSAEAASAPVHLSAAASAKSSATEATEFPAFVDTADEDAVQQFILEVEKQIRATEHSFQNKGRVEIVIVDQVTKLIRCMLEAKLSLTADLNTGFFQTAAEMVVGQGSVAPVFGIYTDYQYWQFLKLDKKVVTFSKKFQLIRAPSEEGDESFDVDAVQIFAHLLEILGVSPSIDLPKSHTAVEEWRVQKALILTENLPA